MKTETLEYFIEVACLESINKAAKSLHLPQQTLSKSIMALERELGIKLFKRSPSGVVLTEAGEDVYRFARWCVEEYRRMWQSDQRPLVKMQLRMAVVETATQILLPQVMSLIYRKDPGLVLSVQKEDQQQRIIELVEARQSEVGIILCYAGADRHYPQISQSLQFIPLYCSVPCFWVSKRSALAEKKSITFNAMQYYPLVGSAGADCRLMDIIMSEHDQDERQMIWADNIYYLAQLVKDDAAIAIDLKTSGVPNLAHILSESAVALPLSKKENYTLTTGAIVHQEAMENPEIQRLLEILKNL